jgi:undecaprenyl-diphosphatase
MRTAAPPRPTEPVAPVTAWDRTTAAGRALGALDDAADRVLDRVRGRRGTDAVAAVVSNLSDYGLVWVLVAGVQARRGGPARRRAVLTLFLAGVTSFTLNRAIKRLAGRQRPEGAANDSSTDAPRVRRPTSSSFPSGHTLAAFTTAIAIGDGTGQQAAALAFASAVAVSRVHLRAHHASDVVGGAVIGTLLGLAVRAAVRRSGPAAVRGRRPLRGRSAE